MILDRDRSVGIIYCKKRSVCFVFSIYLMEETSKYKGMLVNALDLSFNLFILFVHVHRVLCYPC